MKRLFIGILPSEEFLPKLIDIQNTLIHSQEFEKHSDLAKLIPPENFHLTLHFLGELSPASEETLRLDLRKKHPFKPHTQPLNQTLLFPSAHNARVLALGSKTAAPALLQVYDWMSVILQANKIPLQNQRFYPHLSLVRFKAHREWQKIPTLPRLDFKIDHFALFRSQLHSAGVSYSIVEKFNFG